MIKPRKILILTPSLPYPPIWGFGIRVFQILKHLSARHRVTLLTYAGPDDAEKVAPVEAVCDRLVTVPPPVGEGASKRKAQLLSLFTGTSFQRISLASPLMQQAIDRLLAEEAYDLVQLESSQLFGFDFHGRCPVVVDEHNIEYELLLRMCQTEGSPVRRLYNWREYRKFRREEERCWLQADGCVMTSDREEEIVRAFAPGKAVTVAPNGVDIDYFQPTDTTVEPDRIVFTGLISYRPNNDAAIFFVKEVLPLILRRRPNAVFYIVGAGAPDDVKRLAGPHVVVTDTVPDVRPYVHAASVVVVPLRMGSGTRLKVLEGLSMAKPIVSTAVGCEGILVEHEKHLLIANEPEPMADAVVRLMEDRETAGRLASNGRRLVEDEYSWASVVARLEAFHAQVLANRQGAEPAVSKGAER